MSMIFLGDVASPSRSISSNLGQIISQKNGAFSGKRIICNFEGLAFDEMPVQRNEPLLFNHVSVLDNLDGGKGVVLGLANNHVLDYPQQYSRTVELSNLKSYITCGAGLTREEAERPVEFYDGDIKIVLFNACWDFLLYNHRNPSKGLHVAEINEKKIIRKVKSIRNNEADTRIVIFLHWSLDLETLPFPLYRQFARDLIEAGAELVLGSHSHCVQGGEKFGDGYVIYGLGNFLLPNNEYAGGNLSFPELSNTGLAVEWNPSTRKVLCHWFEYKGVTGNHRISYDGAESFEESEKLKHFSPYRGMSDSDYGFYFRKHRRKKLLIPVYSNYRKVFRNKLFTVLLIVRAKTAHFLASLRLIKWQS